MAWLRAEALGCERGGRMVFSGVSFALAAGGLLDVTGPNGAGKSSLLRTIAGLCDAAAGTLALEGGMAELTIGQQCHYAAHQEAIKPALTVVENLKFWGDFLGGGDIAAALAAFDLGRLADFPAALLSAGQKRRLSLSRLKLVPRLVWLLDEPHTGLDAASSERLLGVMRVHLEQGGLIVAASHVPIGIASGASVKLAGPA
jgi:heme exporter protein A